MGKFSITKKQEAAFNEVAKAIKKAQKTGLVFYGKCNKLVAYNKHADNYIEEDFKGSLSTMYGQIEYISESDLIVDSGADEYGCYRSLEDKEKYS